MKNLTLGKFLTMIFCFVFIGVAVCTSGAKVSAQNESRITVNAVCDTVSGAVNVSGKITPEKETDFTILILKNGVDRESITDENILDKVDFIYSDITGEDGSFSVNCLPYDEWSGGEQQVVVAAEVIGFGSFSFISKEMEMKIVKAIKDASADDLGKMMSGELLVESKLLVPYLGIDLSDYNALSDKVPVHNEIAGKEFDSVKELVKALVDSITGQKAAEDAMKNDLLLLNAIKSASDDEMDVLLKENSSRLNIDLSGKYGYQYLKDLYDNGTEGALENVYSAIRGVSSLDKVKATFETEIILSAVNTADQYAIEDILREYESELGVDDLDKLGDLSASKKSDMLRELAAEDFSKLADVAEELSSLIKQYSTSSGSGGGGSSKKTGSVGSMTVPVITEPETEVKVIFSDIDSIDWAKDAISYLSEKNIVNGYPDGTFKPDAPVLREEFVKMLVLSLSLYNSGAECEFDDVPADSWYYKYVASAYVSGISNGMGASFGSGLQITRQEAATMIHRAAVMFGKKLGDGRDFADSNSIADYAKEAVHSIGGAVINGDENGNFNPLSVTTRAQAAKMIYGLLKLI